MYSFSAKTVAPYNMSHLAQVFNLACFLHANHRSQRHGILQNVKYGHT